MTTTNKIRDWWHLYRCSYGTATNMFGRSPVYAQNTSWVRALEQAHYNAGYVPTTGGFIGSKRNCPHGIGGKDCQEDGDDCSLHNYGLAWDVEYQYNPHVKRRIDEDELWTLFNTGVTKYNPDIVRVIEAVKTTGGVQAFTWLGYSLGDFMHWQVNFPPEDQEIDWSTVDNTEDEMTYEQFRTAEFDLWTDENIMSAFDRGRFESTDRAGFERYWVTERSQRKPAEKARFMTDFYSSGSP